MPFNTLGIWLGFDYPLSLKREGIGRVFLYLIKHLLRNYPVNVEIWCYECNYAEVTDMLSELMSESGYNDRIKILTEKRLLKPATSRSEAFKNALNLIAGMIKHTDITNWKEPYRKYKAYQNRSSGNKEKRRYWPVDITLTFILIFFSFIAGIVRRLISKTPFIRKVPNNDSMDCLVSLANRFSKADCFLIYIVTLNNAVYLKVPKLVFLPDLVTLEFSDYFIANDSNAKIWIEHGKTSVRKYGDHGAYFCAISEYVIKNQLLKYFVTIKKEKTTHIYLASMLPDDILSRIPAEKEIRDKYKINRQYIFYPTQIRPYKNIIVLLKALKLLKDKNILLQLVLTGLIKDDPKTYDYAKDNELIHDIILCGSLSETELFGLYRYAEMVISPSLFEGGFPLQALEALSMDTPIILANIPVTVERLKNEGFISENCGLKMFESENEYDLAHNIMKVLDNRQKTVLEQQNVKHKLLSYTWDDVSKHYYELFTKIIKEGRK